MDGQEYLNQIAESSKPIKKVGNAKGSFLSSKYVKVGLIGLAALIVIIILGSLIGGGKESEKDIGAALMLHLKNTSEEVKTFQPDVKSSELRSYSATLAGILNNTNDNISKYMEEKYDLKDNKIDKKLVSKADEAKNELHNELFEAKINGILDRIFAHKMVYEISLIRTEESKLQKAANNEVLDGDIKTSLDSLEKLYDNFSNFSESKQ